MKITENAPSTETASAQAMTRTELRFCVYSRVSTGECGISIDIRLSERNRRGTPVWVTPVRREDDVGDNDINLSTAQRRHDNDDNRHQSHDAAGERLQRGVVDALSCFNHVDVRQRKIRLRSHRPPSNLGRRVLCTSGPRSHGLHSAPSARDVQKLDARARLALRPRKQITPNLTNGDTCRTC